MLHKWKQVGQSTDPSFSSPTDGTPVIARGTVGAVGIFTPPSRELDNDILMSVQRYAEEGHSMAGATQHHISHVMTLSYTWYMYARRRPDEPINHQCMKRTFTPYCLTVFVTLAGPTTASLKCCSSRRNFNEQRFYGVERDFTGAATTSLGVYRRRFGREAVVHSAMSCLYYTLVLALGRDIRWSMVALGLANGLSLFCGFSTTGLMLYV